MENPQKTDDRADAGDRKSLADVRLDQLDMELMNALSESQGTDSAVLGELMSRHARLVYNELRSCNIRRCDIDSVAGRVWEKVWKLGREGRWDSGRARHCSDPFVPLLRTICSSQAIDFHRAATRERRRKDRWSEAAEAFGNDWREALGGGRRQRASATPPRPVGVPPHLAGRVATLPEPLRKVYELYAEGLTNRKISTEVGCSWGEVSKRLNKAREALGLPTNRTRNRKTG